ncbi:MAG: hypothetical protein JO288_22030 [Hyphomicrobiales bacterium]|nr:hypothetical protein [Hyphomicrobiales bacterium]
MDNDLIDVARLLTTHQSGAPRQALLRRAASTAYYAVFHALAARCASSLVTDSGSDWDTYTLVYRALDHNSARRLFQGRDVGTVFGAEVADFGAVFVNLQEARILADYVPQPFPFGKAQVAELVERARSACDIINAMPAGRMRRLAVLLVVRRREVV